MKAKKFLIMIIEDESSIRDMIKFALQSTEFKIVEAEHSQQADNYLNNHLPDLILLDWMLPGKSGIEYARELKLNTYTQHIPIIILTAKAEEASKVQGLEVGADDYITKPFSTRELVARIRTVLRRGSPITPEGFLQLNDLLIDTRAHTVTVGKDVLNLPAISYRLLSFLLKNADRVYTREQLITQVWKNSIDINDRTVDVQIRRLRKYLAPYGYDDCIKTIRSEGYKLCKTTVLKLTP